ncbi:MULTISPECIES: hypothetical protein [Nocardiopsis]|uniref:Uncharacterized protein n=1 Tax=Nocardiopsis sinuspersici TaxID=501010 RepID=A0A1V3BZF0_9ACTN|nr:MULTISPECIES: hypothetical protein [Nocardiopsis]OOC53626.1 hypothetical protein NOSIN_07285 [Nocardiopsis sinuspersici]
MTSTPVESTGRPGTVEAAFLLLLALIAANLVLWVSDVFFVAPTGLDSMRAAAGDGGGLRQAAVSGTVMLLIAAVGVLLAVLIRRGRNWARLLIAAVGALAVLMFLTTVNMDGTMWAAPASAYGLFRDVVPGLLGLAVLVLLFLPASNTYFSRRT